LLRSATLHYAINQTSAFIDSETITRYFFRNRYIARNSEATPPMMPRVGFIRYGRIKTKALSTYAKKIAVQTLRLFHDHFFSTLSEKAFTRYHRWTACLLRCAHAPLRNQSDQRHS